MTSSRYWAARSARRMHGYMEDAEQTVRDIRAAYEAAMEVINEESEAVIRSFARHTGLTEAEAIEALHSAAGKTAASTLRSAAQNIKDPGKRADLLAVLDAPAYKARVARLENLRRDVKAQCEGLYGAELKTSTAFYKQLADDAYMRSIYDVQRGTGLAFGFSALPKSRINQILRTPWSGEHYSSRIWRNTDQLAEDVKAELLVSVMTGRSYDKTAQRIAGKMGSGLSEARRLVRTESCYIANQAEMESYKECGIDEYQFLAVLDGKTSTICQSLDGKKFPVSKQQPGVNAPPMHPWCRSTTVASLDDTVLAKMTRAAKDPETGEYGTVPADMTYRQWKASLEKTGKDGILRSTELRAYEITNKSISSVPLVRPESMTQAQARTLRKLHRDVLRRAKNLPVGTEIATAYDDKLRPIKNFKGLSSASRVRVDSDSGYLIIHNHPDGQMFSPNDIRAFVRMEHTKILTAVGNTGHVYMLEKLPGYDGTGFAAHMMTWVARYPEMMDNVDDYLRLMREALEGGKAYGVRYIQK